MPLARVEIDGRMAADPELRFLPSGVAVANFRVATSDRKREGDQWVDGPPTFISVTCWRDMAENVAESLHTGDPVFVSGKLETRTWTNREGVEQRTLEVTAESVGPSLRWCSARVSRTSRSQAPAQGAQPAQADPWATAPAQPAAQPPQQAPQQAPTQQPWGQQQAPPPQWTPPAAQPAQPAQAAPQYDEPPY